MAPCATARLAGVVAVVLSPLASVITVFAASEDIAEGVVCASLCFEASQKSVINDEKKSSGQKKTRRVLA